MAKLRDWLDRQRARLPSRERGQGLMEYGLIISVVSIAAVVLIMAMGPRVASMFSTAGASAFPSDRRRKGGFVSVSRREVLSKAAAVPVRIWTQATPESSGCHIAAAPEEFHAAFGLGDDQTEVALVDGNGVALTAIQGLYEQLEGQRAHVAVLTDRLAALDTPGSVARRHEAGARTH